MGEWKTREEILAEAQAALRPLKIHELKIRGNTFFAGRNWLEAIAVYSKAIKDCDEPHVVVTLLYNRAAALRELNNFRAAIADLTKALEMDKNFIWAHIRRARCSVTLQEWDVWSPWAGGNKGKPEYHPRTKSDKQTIG